MVFNSTYAGKAYSMVDGEVYVINSFGNMAYAGANYGSTVTVSLTGYIYTTAKGTKMYQTTTGGYIDLNDGWSSVKSDVYYSSADAQTYVNKVIKDNQHILCNNLLCARFSSRLTTAQRAQLYNLQSRLESRNTQLKTDGLVTNQQSSYPAGYAQFGDYLSDFMRNYNVGVGLVLSTTAIIVISAVVVASLSTAAYFAYKYMASESEKDVKFSDELTKTLTSKLTAGEYEQLKEETAGIVTKAKIRQQLSNLGWGARIAIAAVAGYAIYRFIMNRKSN